MTGPTARGLVLFAIGIMAFGAPNAATIRWVEYRCNSLFPDTVFVEPGDTIRWTTNGGCGFGSCYYCYDVHVPGSLGGPFGTLGMEGSGYYEHCDPWRAPTSTAPTSPPVAAGAVPGYYPYIVQHSTACFIGQGNILSGTILVAGVPTTTSRRRWGQIKAIYR